MHVKTRFFSRAWKQHHGVKTTEVVVQQRLEAKGWREEAGFSEFSHPAAWRMGEGRIWEILKWKPKFLSQEGLETRFFLTGIVCLISSVFSQRCDPHSLKHTFFHKNQCASTLRPSHMGGLKLVTAHRKPKQSQTSSFRSFLKEKKILKICIYKHGFVENISDRWVNWRVHQKKRFCLWGMPLVIFPRIVTADSHWTINRLFLSLLVTKMWQVGDDWSRFRVQTPALWNYTRMVKKHHAALAPPPPWRFFERCIEAIKREDWITQIYWCGNVRNIICKNPGKHGSPYTGTRDHWPPCGKAVNPETSTLSVEQQIARTLFFCLFVSLVCLFAHNILHLANTKKKNVYIHTC